MARRRWGRIRRPSSIKAPEPGESPRRRLTFFASPKKVSKERRTQPPATLRFATGNLRWNILAGVRANSLRSDIEPLARSQATPTAEQRRDLKNSHGQSGDAYHPPIEGVGFSIATEPPALGSARRWPRRRFVVINAHPAYGGTLPLRATAQQVISPEVVHEHLNKADLRPTLGAEMIARPRVIYLLYTGDMYGTEQMAITHLRAIQDEASVLIVAPDGPLHAAVDVLGIPSVKAGSSKEVFLATMQFAKGPGSLTVLTASLRHSVIGFVAASLFPWKRTRHFNICHGGTDLARSYGRKRVFNKTPVRLVAVSHYCATLLHRYGVPPHKITVLDNFLADERFLTESVRRERTSHRLRVVAVTRLVGIKKIELLIEALKLQPMLVDKLSVTIVGAGELLDKLRSSAQGLDVTFTGFREDVDAILAESDIFVQTCAVESFGLAVAEAMAAEVMVISPDGGGSAEIVGDERYGLLYKSDDASALAAAMVRAVEMPDNARAAIAAAGAERVRTNYSSSSRRQRLLEVFLPS